MKPDLLCRHCLLPSRSLLRRSLFNHAHDVALLSDHEILAVDFDLGSRPLPEQHSVADFDIQRTELAVIVPGARPGGNHFPFYWFSLRVSGIIMPLAVFSPPSLRGRRTRPSNGRNFMDFPLLSRA